MFDLRLGLALHKSLGEIRDLPYKEVLLWRMFYLAEPWGFAEEEFRSARLLSQMYNQNAPRSKQKPVSRFMRNMQSLVLRAIGQPKTSVEAPDLSTTEGRAQATEVAVQNFKKMFGGRVVDTRKK